jgi:hypothetical protein
VIQVITNDLDLFQTTWEPSSALTDRLRKGNHHYYLRKAFLENDRHIFALKNYHSFNDFEETKTPKWSNGAIGS